MRNLKIIPFIVILLAVILPAQAKVKSVAFLLKAKNTKLYYKGRITSAKDRVRILPNTVVKIKKGGMVKLITVQNVKHTFRQPMKFRIGKRGILKALDKTSKQVFARIKDHGKLNKELAEVGASRAFSLDGESKELQSDLKVAETMDSEVLKCLYRAEIYKKHGKTTKAKEETQKCNRLAKKQSK